MDNVQENNFTNSSRCSLWFIWAYINYMDYVVVILIWNLFWFVGNRIKLRSKYGLIVVQMSCRTVENSWNVLRKNKKVIDANRRHADTYATVTKASTFWWPTLWSGIGCDHTGRPGHLHTECFDLLHYVRRKWKLIRWSVLMLHSSVYGAVSTHRDIITCFVKHVVCGIRITTVTTSNFTRYYYSREYTVWTRCTLLLLLCLWDTRYTEHSKNKPKHVNFVYNSHLEQLRITQRLLEVSATSMKLRTS
jgi:hypothetical protein